MKNVFNEADVATFVSRINQLTPSTTPQWGKMSVSQMLAHCCVTYEMVYENKHPKPNAIVKFLLKTFVKKNLVNEVPYKRNSQTAPAFIIADERDFAAEKSRLIAYLQKTHALGAAHFENKESHSFGALTSKEWNNLFSKHLDHHLSQFGV